MSREPVYYILHFTNNLSQKFAFSFILHQVLIVFYMKHQHMHNQTKKEEIRIILFHVVLRNFDVPHVDTIFKRHYSLTNTRGFPLNCMSGVTPSIYTAARWPFSGVQVLGSQVSQSPSPCSYLVVAGTLGKKIVSFSTLYLIQENKRRLY